MSGNPWDVLSPKEAEKDPDVLFLSVGRALTAWESMQQQFAHFFGFFCGAENTLQARRAYGAIGTFRGQAEVLRAAAEAYFHASPDHEMQKPFFALLKRAGDFAPRRNDIAHGIVQFVFFEGLDNPATASWDETQHARRWLLCPPEHAPSKNELLPLEEYEFGAVRRKYAYSSSEINHYRTQFRKLQSDLMDLMIAWSEAYPEADILPPF